MVIVSLCRKYVQEGKWDSDSLARESHRKMREALNIPEENSGRKETHKRRHPYVTRRNLIGCSFITNIFNTK